MYHLGRLRSPPRSTRDVTSDIGRGFCLLWKEILLSKTLRLTAAPLASRHGSKILRKIHTGTVLLLSRYAPPSRPVMPACDGRPCHVHHCADRLQAVSGCWSWYRTVLYGSIGALADSGSACGSSSVRKAFIAVWLAGFSTCPSLSGEYPGVVETPCK